MLTEIPPNASSPFDDPNADVILRSSDNVDFYVFKIMLSLASPYFKHNFESPQPPYLPGFDEELEGRPVILIPVASRILRKLMEFCHPACAPMFPKDVGDGVGLLQVARMYRMGGVETRVARTLKSSLQQMAETLPFRTYAIACRLGFNDEMQRAARLFLRQPNSLVDDLDPTDLKYITGAQLHRLYQYRESCAQAVQAIANSSFNWISCANFTWIECTTCPPSLTEPIVIESGRVTVRRWWWVYMKNAASALENRLRGETVKDDDLIDAVLRQADQCSFCRPRAAAEMRKFSDMFAAAIERAITNAWIIHPPIPKLLTPNRRPKAARAPFNAADADVIIRSSDNIDFRVFRLLLCLASSFFKDMFSLPQGPSGNIFPDQEIKDGLPVIQMTENCRIVEKLLMFCYPHLLAQAPALSTIEEILPLLKAAMKYGIVGLENRTKEALLAQPLIEGKPLQVFAIACHYRWGNEARVAARHAVRQPFQEWHYAAELETITGEDYYRLRRYHLQCSEAAMGVARSFRWKENRKSIDFTCRLCGGILPSNVVSGVYIHSNHWWSAYKSTTVETLVDSPSPSTLLSPDWSELPLGDSLPCSCEILKPFPDRPEFHRRLAAAIDRAVSEVKLELSC